LRPVPYNQQVSRNGTHDRTPPIPTEERKPAWRRACLAYRECATPVPAIKSAHKAAVAAVQELLSLPWREASAEAGRATRRKAM